MPVVQMHFFISLRISTCACSDKFSSVERDNGVRLNSMEKHNSAHNTPVPQLKSGARTKQALIDTPRARTASHRPWLAKRQVPGSAGRLWLRRTPSQHLPAQLLREALRPTLDPRSSNQSGATAVMFRRWLEAIHAHATEVHRDHLCGHSMCVSFCSR